VQVNHHVRQPNPSYDQPMQDQSRLLLAIPNASASQIYEGERTVLAQGTLNVTLLSHFFDPSTPPEEDIHSNESSPSQHFSETLQPRIPIGQSTSSSSSNKKPRVADNDLYLYLAIGQNQFDFPLPAGTKIIPQGKAAYLIPSQDIPGAIIQLDLTSSPPQDLETLEVLLSQFTAYEERSSDLARKDLVLIDSDDGQLLGSIPQDGLIVNEDPTLLQPGHEKDPVLIDISSDSKMHINTITVRPVPSEYGDQSSIIRTADMISSGILFSSNAISKGIDSSANWYTKKRPTAELPVNFQATTLERVRKIHHLSNSAVAVSAKATGFLASAAHSLGSGIRQTFVTDEEKSGAKPSLLNKSLIAFETIADSFDTSTKQLLYTSSNAATTVVRHKYGDQAAEISHGFGSAVRNVGLVYVDARGVTRKALIKGTAKGMLFKAKVGNSNEVILGGERLESSRASSPPSYDSKRSSEVEKSMDVAQGSSSSYSGLDHPGVWTRGKDGNKRHSENKN
jgi:spartin